jgi:hypothetical protein
MSINSDSIPTSNGDLSASVNMLMVRPALAAPVDKSSSNPLKVSNIRRPVLSEDLLRGAADGRHLGDDDTRQTPNKDGMVRLVNERIATRRNAQDAPNSLGDRYATTNKQHGFAQFQEKHGVRGEACDTNSMRMDPIQTSNCDTCDGTSVDMTVHPASDTPMGESNPAPVAPSFVMSLSNDSWSLDCNLANHASFSAAVSAHPVMDGVEAHDDASPQDPACITPFVTLGVSKVSHCDGAQFSDAVFTVACLDGDIVCYPVLRHIVGSLSSNDASEFAPYSSADEKAANVIECASAIDLGACLCLRGGALSGTKKVQEITLRVCACETVVKLTFSSMSTAQK